MAQANRTDGKFVNLNQLARVLGVSQPTMRAMVKDNPDMPVAARGGRGRAWRFDLDAVLVWRERAQLAAAEKSGQMSPAQLKAYWDAVRVEDGVRLRRNELVERGPLMALLAAVFGDLRRDLLQVPLLFAKETELSRHDRLALERLITARLNAAAARLQDPGQHGRLLKAAS